MFKSTDSIYQLDVRKKSNNENMRNILLSNIRKSKIFSIIQNDGSGDR